MSRLVSRLSGEDGVSMKEYQCHDHPQCTIRTHVWFFAEDITGGSLPPDSGGTPTGRKKQRD